jgi:hypothetical protein
VGSSSIQQQAYLLVEAAEVAQADYHLAVAEKK